MTKNASSIHEGGKILRIAGQYSYSYGPCVADVIAAQSWNLGVEAHHSLGSGNSGAAFYADALMWLDRCNPDDSPGYDLVAEGASDVIYKRLVAGSPTEFTGSGAQIVDY